MYENRTESTSEHAPRATTSGGTATRAPSGADTATKSTKSTDPKFARESFTMRKMQPWQIGALAITAAVAVALALYFYF